MTRRDQVRDIMVAMPNSAPPRGSTRGEDPLLWRWGARRGGGPARALEAGPHAGLHRGERRVEHDTEVTDATVLAHQDLDPPCALDLGRAQELVETPLDRP